MRSFIHKQLDLIYLNSEQLESPAICHKSARNRFLPMHFTHSIQKPCCLTPTQNLGTLLYLLKRKLGQLQRC